MRYLTIGGLSHGWLVFVSALIIFLFTLNSVWATDHSTCFLELDYSIWANHTTSLGVVGHFVPNSVDVFKYQGRYYSALAPGTALFSLPIVAVGIALDGHFTVYGYSMISSELFVSVMNALAVLFVYKLGRLNFGDFPSVFVAFAYGFSTISWPFATFFFQHDVSAAFDLMAVYFVFKASRKENVQRNLLCGGLGLGAALLTDYVSIVLVPVLLTYFVFSNEEGWLRSFRLYFILLIGPSLGVLVLATYNFVSFGRVLVSSEQLYLGSAAVFGNFSTPIYNGIILDLITPYRGILLFSPVLFVGMYGLILMFRSSSTRTSGILLLAVFLSLFLPYCAWYGPDGGLSFGPRFVIASLPFLIVPAGYVLDRRGLKAFGVSYALYGLGVLINGLGALTSALAGTGSVWMSPFFDSTIPFFEQGQLDQWWRASLGPLWPVGAAVLLASAILLPIVFRDRMSRSEPATRGSSKPTFEVSAVPFPVLQEPN